MKKSVLSALLATAVVCVIFVTSSCSTQVKDNDASKDAAGAEETTPVGAVIDSGNISNNTGLNAAYNLDMGRGKYVNLYIENKRSVMTLWRPSTVTVPKPSSQATRAIFMRK